MMADIKKIKRAAVVLFGVVILVLALFLFQQIKTSWWLFEVNAVLLVSFVLSVLFVFASLGVSLTLLHAIRKEETPFTKKVVRKLKTLAILLIVFEPLHFALNLIPQLYEPLIQYFPIEGSDYFDRVETMMTISHGGFILAAGLVVYCVALVFQYGISLQNQADETL